MVETKLKVDRLDYFFSPSKFVSDDIVTISSIFIISYSFEILNHTFWNYSKKYIVDTGILSYDFKIVIYHIVLDDCASFMTVIISSKLGQEIMDSVYFL